MLAYTYIFANNSLKYIRVNSLLNEDLSNTLPLSLIFKLKLKMKKITTLIIAAITIANISFAQKTTERVILNKGQKNLVTTTTNGNVSIEMMGQNMETISESFVSGTLEVKDINTTGYVLTNTVNKMKVKTKGGMAPAMDFDSDKKEDMNSEMGKAIKDNLQPKDMEISFNGNAIEKKDAKKDDEDMAKAMQAIMSGTGDKGMADVFMLLPAGKKAGEVWADSSNANGIKINNTYNLKKINGNEGIIFVNTVSSINKTVNAQGAELTITMDSKISSESIVDLTTGLIKERKTTVEGKGNLGAGGQEMPMTTKVTSVTTVKSL